MKRSATVLTPVDKEPRRPSCVTRVMPARPAFKRQRNNDCTPLATDPASWRFQAERAAACALDIAFQMNMTVKNAILPQTVAHAMRDSLIKMNEYVREGLVACAKEGQQQKQLHTARVLELADETELTKEKPMKKVASTKNTGNSISGRSDAHDDTSATELCSDDDDILCGSEWGEDDENDDHKDDDDENGDDENGEDDHNDDENGDDDHNDDDHNDDKNANHKENCINYGGAQTKRSGTANIVSDNDNDNRKHAPENNNTNYDGVKSRSAVSAGDDDAKNNGATNARPETNVNSNDDENVFDVARIISHKEINGMRWFRIKWTGYGRKHNSWERAPNISHEALKLYKGARTCDLAAAYGPNSVVCT